VKKTLALTVAVVFVLSFAVPVFAQDMTHNAEYEMDGDIDLAKQVGHLCNTGAEMQQVIEGEGEMTKVMDTSQEAGVITVDDTQDWVTAEDAVRNLTVTSAVQLCAPAKSQVDEVVLEDVISDLTEAGISEDEDESVAQVLDALFGTEFVDDLNNNNDLEDEMQAFISAHEDEVIPPAMLYEALQGGTHAGAGFEGVDLEDFVDPLTDQIWAAQVEADPGYSGGLDQSFEAAYGPWADAHGYFGDGEDAFWFVDDEGDQIDLTGSDNAIGDIAGVDKGDDYVGNYFNMDQFARTSEGTVKRYIDISSPWSGAFLHEDMTVTGSAEIDESFAMDNLEPGEEATPDWWELF